MDNFITECKASQKPGARNAALDDTIMHKGYQSAAGSKILENFISPIDATVVTKLEAAGISIVGKTIMDEFGVAGLFRDARPLCGAVGAVADSQASFALVNDCTGAIGGQAAKAGLCCIRPTYGTVSRYGLIPVVPSMDQIGIIAKTHEEGFEILKIIAGCDDKDGAMTTPASMASDSGNSGPARTECSGNYATLRVGVPINTFSRSSAPSTADAIKEFTKHFGTVDIEFMYFDVFAQIMQILCCAEFGSSISRYDGIKFGYRAEGYSDLHQLYTKSRTEAFGADAKLAALIGAMVLSRDNYMRYYDKAMRIRRLIKQSLDWNSYDAIIIPVDSGAGTEHGTADFCLALHALPRLCGLPAVSFPFCGIEAMLVAGPGCEETLSTMLKAVGT